MGPNKFAPRHLNLTAIVIANRQCRGPRIPCEMRLKDGVRGFPRVLVDNRKCCSDYRGRLEHVMGSHLGAAAASRSSRHYTDGESEAITMVITYIL